MKGLHVHPGVIDSDFQGEIKVMCSAPHNVVSIQPGDRIAQLVLVPFAPEGQSLRRKRGTGGFGSSDFAFWVQDISQGRPELTLKVNGKNFKGILDTGADVSVMSLEYWPSRWPLQQAMTQLQGIGQMSSPMRAASLLTWQDEEGHHGTFQPYVLPCIPANLWGRDVLQQMKVKLLTSDSLPF
nr:MAG: protease [Bat faecal associated retrovirus 1]